nr:MAG TPA: hypothetical protein [Caudoviricetes sp.]
MKLFCNVFKCITTCSHFKHIRFKINKITVSPKIIKFRFGEIRNSHYLRPFRPPPLLRFVVVVVFLIVCLAIIYISFTINVCV